MRGSNGRQPAPMSSVSCEGGVCQVNFAPEVKSAMDSFAMFAQSDEKADEYEEQELVREAIGREIDPEDVSDAPCISGDFWSRVLGEEIENGTPRAAARRYIDELYDGWGHPIDEGIYDDDPNPYHGDHSEGGDW